MQKKVYLYKKNNNKKVRCVIFLKGGITTHG